MSFSLFSGQYSPSSANLGDVRWCWWLFLFHLCCGIMQKGSVTTVSVIGYIIKGTLVILLDF